MQQITVGHTKKTSEQLVAGPLPQILGKWWQVCRSYHSGVHANGPVLFDEILKVTQFFPHERIAVVPVPQIMNKLWESQSTFHKGGFSASAASTTDPGEHEEVIQLVRVRISTGFVLVMSSSVDRVRQTI